jgi:hypothetical protein
MLAMGWITVVFQYIDERTNVKCTLLNRCYAASPSDRTKHSPAANPVTINKPPYWRRSAIKRWLRLLMAAQYPRRIVDDGNDSSLFLQLQGETFDAFYFVL